MTDIADGNDTHGRSTVDSPESRERLLNYVAGGDSLTDAGTRIGITRTTIARWRKNHPEFAAGLDAAFDTSTDVLETEARARALDRADKHSAGLLRYLITGRRERWRKLQAEELEQIAEDTTPELSDFEIARRISFLLAEAERKYGSGALQEKSESE